MIRKEHEKLLVRLGTDYGEMNVRVWTVGDAKRTVFCLHGYANNSGDFEFLGDFLAAKGCNVVCPDLIGRGDSAYFGRPEPYAFANIMTCLTVLADRYRTSTNHLLGTSWGGALALFLHRSGALHAASIVLNDMPVVPTDGQQDFRRMIKETTTRSFADSQSCRAWLTEIWEGVLGPFPPGRRDSYVDAYVGRRGDGYAIKLDPALADMVESNLSRRFDFSGLLAATNIPLLLLYGKRSPHRTSAQLPILLAAKPNITCIDNLEGGHPPLLMTADQALMVTGFFLGQQQT